MRLKIIIPALLIPVLAAAALFSGVLSADVLPFLQEAEDAIGSVGGEVEETLEADGGTSESQDTASPADDTSSSPDATTEAGDSTDEPGTADTGSGEDAIREPPDPDAPLITATEGYLQGAEHGVALVQTARVDSPTHQGWVDITLDLVLTRYGTAPDAAPQIAVSADGTAVCFTNTTEPHDCFAVQWGSIEQFEAILKPRQAPGTTWPVQKAWPYTVTFEIPGNADRASFFFGPNRVELDLRGEPRLDLTGFQPVAITSAPVDEQAPVWAAGYYLGEQHGLAVTAVRRTPHVAEPTWVRVELDLAIMTFTDGPEFDLPLAFQSDPGSTCLTSGGANDCVRVLWGPIDQFDAVLTSQQTVGHIPWPRFKAWPTTLSFPVPDNVLDATLVFGTHAVHLDLRGAVGDVPAWNYRAHYFQLGPDLVLYDSEAQTTALVAIDHDTETGDATLVFRTVNDKENADFFPRVFATAARVSSAGRVFDGLSVPKGGWKPVVTRVQGDTLAPGQEGIIELRLPRVAGPLFDAVAHASDRLDAMLLKLVADDHVPGSGDPAQDAPLFEPVFVPFDRDGGGSEANFFFPDLVPGDISIDPSSPTAGDGVTISITIANQGPRNAAATTLRLDVSDTPAATVPVPAIAVGRSVVITVPWIVTVEAQTLTGTVDPDGTVAESSNDNNAVSLAFAGGALPDLVVSDVSFSIASPSVGDAVEITVTVTNNGPGRSANSRVAAYMNSGSVTFFMSYPGLTAGASSTSLLNWIAVPGPFYMTFTADGFSDVPEHDESNNTTALIHDATLLADLLVVDVTFDTDVIAVGEDVTFTIHTRNAGPGRAAASTMALYVNGAETPEFTFAVPQIAPGEIVESAFVWKIVQGLTEFRAVSDTGPTVPETNETNNENLFAF